jgi:hypothetical protein
VTAGNYEIDFSCVIGKPKYLVDYDKFVYWFILSLSRDEYFEVQSFPQI